MKTIWLSIRKGHPKDSEANEIPKDFEEFKRRAKGKNANKWFKDWMESYPVTAYVLGPSIHIVIENYQLTQKDIDKCLKDYNEYLIPMSPTKENINFLKKLLKVNRSAGYEGVEHILEYFLPKGVID